MTTATKPRPFKRKTAQKALEGCKDNYRRYYQDAKERGMTHEWLMAHTKQWIYETEPYKRLPDWAHEILSSFSMYLFNEWQHSLIWTHILDGQRLHAGHALFEGRYGEIGQQDAKSRTSEHCYGFVVQGKLVFVPNTQEAIDKDIAAGRLAQADLERIRNYHYMPCPRVSLISGKLYVPVVHEVDYSTREIKPV